MIRRFVLQRDVDVTGVSGTGVVAEGVEFTDGVVVLKWVVGEFRSLVTWVQGIHAVEAVHGHDNRTLVIWIDE